MGFGIWEVDLSKFLPSGTISHAEEYQTRVFLSEIFGIAVLFSLFFIVRHLRVKYTNSLASSKKVEPTNNTNFNKGDHMDFPGPKKSGKTFIGKKVVVQIGGDKPIEDNPNEIVGQKEHVHIHDSELGKYDTIIGVENTVTIGSPSKSNK